MDKRKIDSIYSEILDLPRHLREERLETLCEGDSELRQAVEELLGAADQPLAGSLGDRIEGIRSDYWRAVVGDEPDRDEEDLSGELIGIWRLETQIGRGGLATVYSARREDGEFSQLAAFKVMRRGLDTDDLITRFRTEREILATLDHPCIARILDGGSTPDGRPYLVLEYVDGISITEYVDQHALPIRDRVRLLRDVATALNHAHQHLVVHRDVKPSNVMVTHDGAVRLLDFGIAKILDPSDLPISSSLTRTGVALLTPSYGSPEQLGGQPITTRSDIYQLGLLMAEILSGRRPTSAAGQAAQPNIEGVTDRDLIAIIQKATREEIGERYDSATEFEAELDRYLTDRPVHARPDSWGYRLRKTIKRRPFLLPAGIAVGLAICIYVVTITIYTQEIQRERQIAEKTQQFMIGLFESPDPRAPADPERGRTITVVEALEIGRPRVMEELTDQPYLQVSLSRAISAVYEGLDQFRPAIELRELAHALEEELYGRDSWAALDSLRVLARLYMQAGEISKATELVERQLELTRSRVQGGAVLGVAEYAVGSHAFSLGDYKRAETLLKSALERIRASDDAITHTIATLRLLAIIEGTSSPQARLQRMREAEALAISAYGPNSVRGAIARAGVASSLTLTGDYAEAEVRLLEILRYFEETLGDQHTNTRATLNNLGVLYVGWNRHAEAEAIHAQLLERNLEIYGATSGQAGNSYQNLATAIARQGRFEEALPLHRRAFEIYSGVYGESHHRTAYPLLSTAYIHLLQKQGEQAEASARQALALLDAALPDSYLVGTAQCLLGLARNQQGDESGLTLVENARELMRLENVPAPYRELCGVQPET